MTTHAHVSLGTVLRTGAAVVVLWAISFGLSYASLGVLSLPIALAVAVMKAVLVALFFMELVRASLSIKMTVAAACAMTLTLVGFMVADVVTRDTPALVVPPR